MRQEWPILSLFIFKNLNQLKMCKQKVFFLILRAIPKVIRNLNSSIIKGRLCFLLRHQSVLFFTVKMNLTAKCEIPSKLRAQRSH